MGGLDPFFQKRTFIGAIDSLEHTTQMSTLKVVTPFLKWVGGKSQIIGDVMQLFPRDIQNYHECFLGGGSVLLALLSHTKNGTIRVSGTVYASDLNSNLIGLYKNVQSNVDALIADTKKLTDEFARCVGTDVNRAPTSVPTETSAPESYYYWIRSRFNSLDSEHRTSVEASAMFLFMNKTCFRGVYREGPRGFNVPFGNYKKPTVLDEAHIREVSSLIADVVFTNCSFEDSLARVTSGDFVYLDPPYAPETGTSFVGYTSDGFGLDKHTALFKTCAEMKTNNVKMLMSNANVKLVQDAFAPPDFQVRTLKARRSINSKNPEATTMEVLITN